MGVGDEGMGEEMSYPIWCPIRDRYCMCVERCTGIVRSPDDEYEDAMTDDNPYCECGAVHSGIEDGGRCEACGKVI